MWKRAETGSAAPGRSLSSSSHPVRHECFISPLSNDQAAEENKSGEWCIAFLCQFFFFPSQKQNSRPEFFFFRCLEFKKKNRHGACVFFFRI